MLRRLKLLEHKGDIRYYAGNGGGRVKSPTQARRFWPDKETIYMTLRYLSQQVDIWRRQLAVDKDAFC